MYWLCVHTPSVAILAVLDLEIEQGFPFCRPRPRARTHLWLALPYLVCLLCPHTASVAILADLYLGLEQGPLVSSTQLVCLLCPRTPSVAILAVCSYDGISGQ